MMKVTQFKTDNYAATNGSRIETVSFDIAI